MPIFGKLSDMYGRKLFYLLGLSLFMIGSILCGMAQSMVQLSIFRAIQGLGGGAIMPIAFTIIFDIFPPQERGKINGLFGAVFGLSSVFGPLFGAYFTDYIHWRWVFYINIPLGLISLIFIYKFYKESLEHREQKIDWWGAILLVIAIVSLMFALELGGKEYAWDSAVIMSLFASFVVFSAVFLWVETKASDPIINLKLFKNHLFAATQGVGFFYGTVFILATMYLPIFVQGVFGGSATNAGLILIPLMLGVVAGSQIGGRTIGIASYRNIMLGSGVSLLIGMYLLGTISTDTSRWLVTVYMILAGLSVGVSFPVLNMSAVHGLEMHERGVATSAVAFFRVIGMALGISIFGTIQNHLLVDKLHQVLPAFDSFTKQGFDSRALLQPEVRAHIPGPVLAKITDALASSIATIFQWSLISVCFALVCIFIMGNARLKIPQRMASKE
jgi:EmrB/QacA subfamily drug resistance transporter